MKNPIYESLNPVLIQICDYGDYGFAKALLDNGVNDLNVSELCSYHFFLIVCLSAQPMKFHYLLLHNILINLLIEDGANVNIQNYNYVSICTFIYVQQVLVHACCSEFQNAHQFSIFDQKTLVNLTRMSLPNSRKCFGTLL